MRDERVESTSTDCIFLKIDANDVCALKLFTGIPDRHIAGASWWLPVTIMTSYAGTGKPFLLFVGILAGDRETA